MYLMGIGAAIIFWGILLATANKFKDDPRCESCKCFVVETPVFEIVFLTIFWPLLLIVLLILTAWFVIENILEIFKDE